MNELLRARFGDPCRGCEYAWSLGPDACAILVSGAPARFRALVADNPSAIHPALGWNATAYVAHMADVLRIWAERVAATAIDRCARVVPYDEGHLGEVRGYNALSVSGAPLWALERSAGDWIAAERLAELAGAVVHHPEQGRLMLDDVRRIMAHEVEHHAADLSLLVSS